MFRNRKRTNKQTKKGNRVVTDVEVVIIQLIELIRKAAFFNINAF